MAILKRSAVKNIASRALHELFVGYPTQITMDLETGTTRFHDGITPGGIFEINEGNSLTLTEIESVLDNKYSMSTATAWKSISDVRIDFDASGKKKKKKKKRLNRSAELVGFIDGLQGYLFENGNDNNEVWSITKIGCDYVAGSGVKFFIDWSVKDNDSGDVVWGIEYTICAPDQIAAFQGSSLEYLRTTVTTDSERKLFTSKNGIDELVEDDSLTKGSVVLSRFFRNKGSDTFDGDVLLFNAGIEYLGGNIK